VEIFSRRGAKARSFLNAAGCDIGVEARVEAVHIQFFVCPPLIFAVRADRYWEIRVHPQQPTHAGAWRVLGHYRYCNGVASFDIDAAWFRVL